MLDSRVTEFCDAFLRDRGAGEIWVACSGGLDSMALLELVREYGRRRRLPVGVAHFNHNLRPASREDELLVRDRAVSYGLPLVVGQGRDLAGRVRKERHRSLETVARAARYAFFRRLLEARKGAVLLTAHQADDQAETVLMNLMRGSGLRGLKGIPARRGRIGRPLLATTRAELYAWAREHGLVYREDESNASALFFRNRVRAELLPVIRRLGGDGVIQRIAGAARRLAGDLEFIDRQLAPCLEKCESCPGGLLIDRESFAALPPALKPHLLGAMIRRSDGRSQVPARVLEDLCRLAEEERRESQYDLGAGLVFRGLPGGLFIGRPEPGTEPLAISDYQLEIAGFGSFELPCGLGRIELYRTSPGGSRKSRKPVSGPWEERVDGDRLLFPLTLRNRRPGDRFAPLGIASRHRKLKKFFQERKLSRAQRRAWPLLVNADGEIVWAPGLRLGHGFRLQPETRSPVILAFFPGSVLVNSSRDVFPGGEGNGEDKRRL